MPKPVWPATRAGLFVFYIKSLYFMFLFHLQFWPPLAQITFIYMDGTEQGCFHITHPFLDIKQRLVFIIFRYKFLYTEI